MHPHPPIEDESAEGGLPDEDFGVSKTRRKKEMHDLQDMGALLIELNNERLNQLTLPDSLRDAVIEARRITKFGARKRQLQYIGKLMRDVDPAPIRTKLDEWSGKSRELTAHHHRLERWRERLLADDAALSELLGDHPTADGQRLRTLIRNARHEHQADKPPKSSRALFRELRDLLAPNADEPKDGIIEDEDEEAF